MALRVLEVVAAEGNVETILAAAKKHAAIDAWRFAKIGDERVNVRILAATDAVQPLIDTLQAALGGDETARIILIPALATLPEVKDGEDEARKAKPLPAAREELYAEVAQGAEINNTFLLLVLLSTLVAALGLLADNIAVVIGAMVIAPLLGPNLAFAFGAALGDRRLMLNALRTNLIGIGLTIGITVLAGRLVPLDFASKELLARTTVSYASVVIALASGAAAVLSLTSGLSSTLVGVMVAVALLPPAVTFGLMLGAGDMTRALGAGTLLAVNLVSINLSAQVVLLSRGIKPRTWWEKQGAKQSVALSMILWALLLAILIIAISFEGIHFLR